MILVMLDHSRQLEGLLCALAPGIGMNAKVEREELNAKDECKEYLNPNAQNLKQTLNLAGVVHHILVMLAC